MLSAGTTEIAADQINIQAVENRNEDQYRQRFEQKGITVSVSSVITDIAQTASVACVINIKGAL